MGALRGAGAARQGRHAGLFANASAALWQLAVQLELEGIIAKDASSIYSTGRTTRWLKIETEARASSTLA
jgi:ATP-dependent DNA ligase